MSNNYITAAKIPGSELRRRKRAHDPSAFTRAQACRLIAVCEDSEIVRKFRRHVNSHVQKSADRKLIRLAEREKRVAAAKKAAATRAAKKAEAVAS